MSIQKKLQELQDFNKQVTNMENYLDGLLSFCTRLTNTFIVPKKTYDYLTIKNKQVRFQFTENYKNLYFVKEVNTTLCHFLYKEHNDYFNILKESHSADLVYKTIVLVPPLLKKLCGLLERSVNEKSKYFKDYFEVDFLNGLLDTE